MYKESYIGKIFGRLTVIEELGEKDGSINYLCACSCSDKKVEITRWQLQHDTRSCGCLQQEQRSQLGLARRKLEPRIATAKFIYDQRYADGDLTFEQFLELTQLPCTYCGNHPTNSFNRYNGLPKEIKVSQYAIDNGTFTYNGLDRKNSDFPHNLDNVVSACFTCNRIKSDMPLEEFYKWMEDVYQNWAKKYDHQNNEGK